MTDQKDPKKPAKTGRKKSPSDPAAKSPRASRAAKKTEAVVPEAAMGGEPLTERVREPKRAPSRQQPAESDAASSAKSESWSLLGPQDVYLFNEGTNHRLHEKLGARPATVDGKEGTYFAVWAPNAEEVSVVGEFNGLRTAILFPFGRLRDRRVRPRPPAGGQKD